MPISGRRRDSERSDSQRGPRFAYKDTDCQDCGDLIEEDEAIYFTDRGRLCFACAARDQLVCPACNGQKKPEYPSCYHCKDIRVSSKISRVKKGS